MVSYTSFSAHRQIKRLASPARAKILSRFFKTGPGDYGEGDKFAGLTVPQTRQLAKKFSELLFTDLSKLLNSKIHEERLLALLILVGRYEKNESEQEKIYRFYLQHAKQVNNWDLVDLSADKIVGRHLLGRSIDPLLKLARSKNLWERRMAVVATFQFIKHGRFQPTLKIVKILLSDEEDLIHKACGWMLREIGKRNRPALENFLKSHILHMSRTTLRYAIEHFKPPQRRRYLLR